MAQLFFVVILNIILNLISRPWTRIVDEQTWSTRANDENANGLAGLFDTFLWQSIDYIYKRGTYSHSAAILFFEDAGNLAQRRFFDPLRVSEVQQMTPDWYVLRSKPRKEEALWQQVLG